MDCSCQEDFFILIWDNVYLPWHTMKLYVAVTAKCSCFYTVRLTEISGFFWIKEFCFLFHWSIQLQCQTRPHAKELTGFITINMKDDTVSVGGKYDSSVGLFLEPVWDRMAFLPDNKRPVESTEKEPTRAWEWGRQDEEVGPIAGQWWVNGFSKEQFALGFPSIDWEVWTLP